MERVLVIDDDAGIRELLAECLAEFGFEVETARNGAEGIERLSRWMADLIVLDLVMPEMDGDEFVRQCRCTPAVANIPILVCTGTTASVDGARGRLEKPFAVGELLDAVRLCLGHEPAAPAGRKSTA